MIFINGVAHPSLAHKMAAATELIAQRDEALALAAAKDVEIEQLKAQLASR